MDRKKPGVDVISDILKMTLAAYPDSTFIQSLSCQYIERGGLSKKQLEGLYKKAVHVKNIPDARLSTMQAIILKKPTRYKSQLPAPKPLYTKDTKPEELIKAILEKFPQHKRVLFLQTKYYNNEVLSSAEKIELEKFYKLLK